MPDEPPQGADHRLADRDDVVLLDEAQLDVELGELRLAVGAEVLVAVAARDLVVPLHPRDHQQLLEQLRALRQRVPAARLQPRRHQEVAGALRRRPRQRRGLDLDEPPVVQQLRATWFTSLRSRIAAPGRAGAGRGTGSAAAPPPPPRRGRRSGTAAASDGERRDQRRHDDLDLAGGQVRVRVARPAGASLADDPQAVLAAQRMGDLRVTHDHLHHALRVAQVDERHAAVVAAARHPAGQGDGPADVLGAQGAGVVRADHLEFLPVSCGSVRVTCGCRSAAGGVQDPGSSGDLLAGADVLDRGSSLPGNQTYGMPRRSA